MPYRALEHTADLALEVEGSTREELFAEALRGWTDCVTDLRRVEPRLERTLAVRAPDDEQLLVEWLGEAVYAFESRGELYCEAAPRLGRSGGETTLEAAVRGEAWDRSRHPVKILIKGVTYHRLKVEETAAGWRARVVFDI